MIRYTDIKRKLSLDNEEKILCLVPVFGFYIDIIVTFFMAGSSDILLLYEKNNNLKNAVSSGVWGVFNFNIKSSILIFIFFLCCMYFIKLMKLDKKFMYIGVFTFFGYRIFGASTWVI